MMIVFTGLVLTASACGGDGGNDGEDLSEAQTELADGLKDSLDADPSEGISDEDADCAAVSIASVFTDERIEELGLDRETVSANDFGFEGTDLTDEEGAGLAEAINTCIDLEQVLIASLTADGISEESATCLIDELPDNFFEDAVTSGFLNDGDLESVEQEQDPTVILNAFSQCLSPEEFSEITTG